MAPQIITDYIADPQLVLQRIRDGFYPKPPRPTMPPFDRVRRDFMQLMPRHLEWVEEIGIRPDFDRQEMYDWFMANYDRLFGPLRRPKAKAVPSDVLRQGIIVSRLLSLIELRREEIAANVLPGCLPVQSIRSRDPGCTGRGSIPAAKDDTALAAGTFNNEITMADTTHRKSSHQHPATEKFCHER